MKRLGDYSGDAGGAVISESSEDKDIFKLMDQWIDWCGFEDVSVRNMFSALEEEVESACYSGEQVILRASISLTHLPNHSSFEQGVTFDPTDIQWPSSVEEANSRFIPEYVTTGSILRYQC